MANFVITKNKGSKHVPTREELELLDKTSLVDRIMQLEAHNFQLRRIIKKAENPKDGSKEKKSVAGKAAQRRFDFSQSYKRHIFLKFFYLGWNYHGFVEQEDNNNTVEEHIFNALTKSCCIESRQTSNYHRCGRTDKGVSAFSQVISLDIRSRLAPEDRNKLEEELEYCKILNRLLPRDIKCIAWSPAEESQSARFDCKRRTYKYFFPRGNLNIRAMNEAAQYIVGVHDFRNFCKMDVGNGVTRFERRVIEAKIVAEDSSNQRETEEKFSGYDMCTFVITSQAFLWHQIRCIMGVLLLVGQEQEEPEVIRQLFDINACPRKPQYSLAHELPLNLYDCQFEEVRWFYEQSELLEVIKSLEQDWSFDAIKATMMKNMLDDLKIHLNDVEMKSNFSSTALLQGVQSKIYQPLMKRLTCESLENRIKHYEKKRKIHLVEDEETGTAVSNT